MKSEKWIKIARIAFQVLIYLSVIFLAYYLSKIDYLSFRQFDFNPVYLIISLVVLYAGFLVSPLAWHDLLNKHKIGTGYRQSLVSEGLYIFSKYIPGKVMIVLGRAGYISLREKSGLREAGLVSLKAQVLAIIAGLNVGMFALPGTSSSWWIYLLYFGFLLTLLLYFNNKHIHELVLHLVRKITRRNMDMPLVRLRESQRAFYYYLLMWLCWSGGFYFLLLSVGYDSGWNSVFILSLASTLGIVTIISPGGLGIREGILVVFLHRAGIGIETATAISVLARLWYISGEIFVFVVANAVKMKETSSD